jgi:dephospho-CoA kinase
MNVIGITGSIGMGKSHVANLLKSKAAPIFDADNVVKSLYSNQRFLAKLKNKYKLPFIDKKIIQMSLDNGVIDIKSLEKIILPIVERKLQIFLQKQKMQNKNLILLEIPLLFENNYQKYCNQIIVVFSNPKLQIKRLLRRPNMTIERIKFFEKLQIPTYKKKYLANNSINTAFSKNKLFWELIKIVKD